MGVVLKVLEQWLSQPYLQLDCCSSTAVGLTLWWIIAKVQIREWVRNGASGCSLAVFMVVLTALLMPAPGIDFFGVVHALIRSGLLAAVAFIVLVFILPIVAKVWEHTAVRFYRATVRFVNDVDRWFARRQSWVAAHEAERREDKKRLAYQRYLASLPPPPPPPTYEELAQKAVTKREEGLRVAALIADEIDRNFEIAEVEQEYRDDIQKAKRFRR